MKELFWMGLGILVAGVTATLFWRPNDSLTAEEFVWPMIIAGLVMMVVARAVRWFWETYEIRERQG